MKFPQLSLAVSILFLVDKYFTHFSPVARAQDIPYERPLLKLATGSIPTTLFKKVMRLGGDEKPKCALSLSNNLTRHRLIDPLVYLEHGEHPIPVPVKIETNSTIETVFEAAATTKDTSGLLFYTIEGTGNHLVIFWKVSGPQAWKTYSDNRFFVDIIKANKFSDKEATLKILYNERKSFADVNENPLVRSVSVDVLGTKISERPIVAYRAQMTTEKDSILNVVLTDSLSVSHLQRRSVTALTTVGLGLAVTIFNVLFKQLMKKIPLEQTGTIKLENLSTETSLTNPSWVIFAGHTTSIVPWHIKPSETGTITWRSPLGGIQFKDSWKRTVHFLSYQIDGTNYYIVIGSVFPLKMCLNGKTRFTVFVMEAAEYVQMKDRLLVIAKGLEKVNIHELGSYLVTNKLIAGSFPHIYGIDATKIVRYYEWQFPIFTPPVNRKRSEYHVKIVAAVGFGKALGLTAQVEVLPGASPRAESFKAQNPQIYREPMRTTTIVTSGAGTGMPSVNIADKAMQSTIETQPQALPINGNQPGGSTVSDSSMENTSATRPASGIPTNKIMASGENVSGMGYMRKISYKKSSGASHEISENRKHTFQRSSSNRLKISYQKGLRKAVGNRESETHFSKNSKKRYHCKDSNKKSV